MSTSFFSAQFSDWADFSLKSSSLGSNKEWQVNGEPNSDKWIRSIDKKENLVPYSLAIDEPQIENGSSLTPAIPSCGESSDSSGGGCTSAFPGSLSQLFSSKLGFFNSEWGNSATSLAMELNREAEADDDILPSSKEFESRAIGSLLPDDEDELLAGMIDDLDAFLPSHIVSDTEDVDFFSSGGGMEIENEVPVSLGLYKGIWSGHPKFQHTGPTSMAGEHPSRTLFVRNINSNVEESELRNLFEQYGDIRNLYTACKHRGFVMISYYDIRAACNAMWALQNTPLRRRKLDIHFSIPKDNPSNKDVNQGTLVVFNLDTSVSNDKLRQIFSVYGEIKEIRETAHKQHHKFVEFYDVRAAEVALWELNGCEIAGKCIKLELSHPGGAHSNLMQQISEELEREKICSQRHHVQIPGSHSPSGHPSHWAAITSIGEDFPIGNLINIHAPLKLHGPSPTPLNRVAVTPSPHTYPTNDGCAITHFGHFNTMEGRYFDSPNGRHGMSLYQNSNSLPDFHAPASSQIGFLPSSISSVRVRDGEEESRSQKAANRSNVDVLGFDLGLGVRGFSSGVLSISNDKGLPLSGRNFLWGNSKPYLHHPQNSPPLMSSPIPSANTYTHIGGTWQQHHHPLPGMHSNFEDALNFGSAPSGKVSGMDMHHGFFSEPPDKVADFRNLFGSLGFMSPQQKAQFFSNGGPTGPFINCMDGFHDRIRTRRGHANSMPTENKKLYQLDLDRILSGEDPRTTLMIKNIPNKYKVNMLLAAIDEHHRGTYDFIYLPIDFKNKCNVGYAFINMVDPSRIVPFYEAFDGKKWERFNSEKVASLAYARIQGKDALIAHFKNSSLMNEDERCRPILFHTDGQNEPFPFGTNIHTRSIKDGNCDGNMRPESPSDSSSSTSKDEYIQKNVNPESSCTQLSHNTKRD